VLKLKGKHFIDPKRSEILSVFHCTTQIALGAKIFPKKSYSSNKYIYIAARVVLTLKARGFLRKILKMHFFP
jgi:hypothetical protein